MILAVLIYESPRYFVPSFEYGLKVQEKKYKNDFQDVGRGSHLGFLNETILAIFYLNVALILSTKFRVYGLSIQEKFKKRFSRRRQWRPSWISDLIDFSYFWSTSRPDNSYRVSSQLAFWFSIRSSKYIFKTAAILDFDLNDFNCFRSTSHLDTSNKVSSQLVFHFRRRISK